MKISFIFILCYANFSRAFVGQPFEGNPLLRNFLNAINPDKKISLEHKTLGINCNRECKLNDTKICHFHFRLKSYQIMGGACGSCNAGNITECLHSKCVIADGVKRGFLSINLQLPAPAIIVCKGDIVIVDLLNEAEGSASSIHWHGMRQFGTQYSDGVPYLTQCPIPYGAKFRYAFHADDEGTHFYHSHSGHQKADGVYGPLIIRTPIETVPNAHLYDFDLPDHLIIISDWMHHMADQDFPGVVRRSVLTESILINGHGRYYNKTTNSYTFAPWSVFNVKFGSRYRFRFITSGFNVCPFMLQIENHNMSIIATELSYVEPFTIDTLYSMSGERFDFVIHANQTPRDYWMRVRALAPCVDVETFAILRYSNEHLISQNTRVTFSDILPPRISNMFPKKIVFNSPLPRVLGISLLKLRSLESDKELINSVPDHKFFLFLDSPTIVDDVLYNNGNTYKFMFSTSRPDFNSIGTFNNISLSYPPYPLLTQPEDIDESIFCDENNTIGKQCVRNKTLNSCRCTHRIKAKLNSIVEFVVVNIYDQIPHPVHLHGYKFHILDMGLFNERPTPEAVRNGGIPNVTLQHPPYKDTVVLPYPGFVRLRFRADNPGWWLFHCHFDWHLTTGMALILQVGESHQMTKPPKNFPRCNDFTFEEIN